MPLKHIINLIFKTGTIPHHFKISVITPIYKSGPVNKIQNYRPISLINELAKIFEKALKERLINFFKVNKTISSNQYGFTEGISTADAIQHLTSEISKNLDDSNKTIVVFMDLAKAFDTVPHEQLLSVLQHYGVRGIVLRVFENYLSNRYQHTKINNSISSPGIIKTGVPQGTILGPILFTSYINSLLGLELMGKAISYADDTALIFTGKTWDEVKQKVIIGFNCVKNWLESFKLSLNLEKTNYIAFSPINKNRPEFDKIFINENDSITSCQKAKYLGIIIDQHLKWTHHIDYVTIKIRKLIHKFYILREILNDKLAILIYKALVESLLRYGITAWGGAYKTTLKPLQVIQNYILKIIFKKNKLYSTKGLYNEKLFNIRQLYILSSCIYMHKREKSELLIGHQHNTRSKSNKNVTIPKSQKTLNLKFLNTFASKCYNLLPLNIKNKTRSYTFNKNCKEFIYKNYEAFEGIT